MDKEVVKKIRTKTFYLYDDQEKVFLKSPPGQQLLAKRKDGEEFVMEATNPVFIRAMFQKDITHIEYETCNLNTSKVSTYI
jgi:hypothetical protein